MKPQQEPVRIIGASGKGVVRITGHVRSFARCAEIYRGRHPGEQMTPQAAKSLHHRALHKLIANPELRELLADSCGRI